MKRLSSFSLNEPAYWTVAKYLNCVERINYAWLGNRKWFTLLSKLTYSISKKYGIPPSQVASKEYIMYVDEVIKRRPDIFK